MYYNLLIVFFTLVSSTLISSTLLAKEPIECHSMDTCFKEIIQQRHSGYEFDPSRTIDPSILLQLAEASRFSPSSYNEQPWSFLFCDALLTPEAYLKALNTLADANQDWAQQAPLLVIVASKTNFERNEKPNLWDKFDTGAAVMSFCYRATSLGLMTHEIGGFDATQVKNEFSIPDGYEPIVVIAVGYESPEEENLPHEKDRLDLSENFFLGQWELPLSK
jgi:nitroreductase